MQERALANRMDDDALASLVAAPELSDGEKERLRSALYASAAPLLVPRVWVAPHTHAACLTSSPAVQLCVMPPVVPLVIEALASPTAAHAAALAAAARECCSHSFAGSLRLHPPVRVRGQIASGGSTAAWEGVNRAHHVQLHDA